MLQCHLLHDVSGSATLGLLIANEPYMGDMAQEVRAIGGRVAGSIPPCVVSLSKKPNPQLLLTCWLVPCMAANRRWCMNG